MIRAFLAIETTEALRRQLARVQGDLRRELGPDLAGPVRISWPQPASMHLTLKFIGDTEERLVGRLRDPIERAVAGHRVIRVPLERIGAFPRPREPRVLWIGPSAAWDRSEDAGRVHALHQAVDEACASLEFSKDERPFSPHLTLARIKAGERHAGRALARIGAIDRAISLSPLDLTSIVLMKSELRSEGAVHTRLWEVQLEKP